MRDSDTSPNIASLIFECLMAVIYLAIAYVLLFTHVFDKTILSADNNLRLMFGIILGLYGAYRIYRVINRVYVQRRRRKLHR